MSANLTRPEPAADNAVARTLAISPEKAFYVIVKARAFDEKVEASDLGGGSNPTDDLDVDVLEDRSDDPGFEELMSALQALNEDELLDLIALVWLGRGDFTFDEWSEARRQADDMPHKHIPRYLVETPLLGDYLEEALAQFGHSFESFELNRL